MENDMELVLAKEKVYIAKDDFTTKSHIVLGALTGMATDLGASIASIEECTIIIGNPLYTAPSDPIRRLRDLASSRRQRELPQIYPYHYLAHCYYHSRKVEELDPPSPYMIHPDKSQDNRPLLVYVSVNIQTRDRETAEQSKRNVERALSLAGAIIVTKRSQADLLIIRTTTLIYKQAVAEKKRRGNFDQRFAERAWVEECLEEQKVDWRTTLTGDEDLEDDDSMKEDDMPKVKPVGRPSGGVRREYTQADDEFLVRYLAAFYPSGPWASVRTFRDLTDYDHPLARNHSEQSWLERFKKNKGFMAPRVERMAAAGIDENLNTRAERGAEREAEANKAEEKAQTFDAAAGSSRNTDDTRLNAKVVQKKTLVEESDEEEEGDVRERSSAPHKGKGRADEESTLPPRPSTPTNSPAKIPIQVHHPPQREPASHSEPLFLPSAYDHETGSKSPPRASRSRSRSYSPAARKKPASEGENRERTQTSPAKKTPTSPSVPTEPPDQVPDPIPGGKTPGVLGDKSPRLEQADISDQRIEPPNGLSAVPSSARLPLPVDGETTIDIDDAMVDEALFAQSQSPSLSSRPARQDDRISTPFSPVKKLVKINDQPRQNPIPSRSPERLARLSAPISARSPVPAQVPETMLPPSPSPATQTTEPNRTLSSIKASDTSRWQSSGTPFERKNTNSTHATPSVKRPRESLAQKIALTDKKRRIRESLSAPKSKIYGPDTVDPVEIFPPFVPKPAPEVENRRSASPPLSYDETRRRIDLGAAVVRDNLEVYKAKMKYFGETYGMTPGEVSRVLNSVREKKMTNDGQIDWDDLEGVIKRAVGQ